MGEPLRHRILSITTNRSDVSILSPVWRALGTSQNASLSILATGAHCLDAAKAESQLAGFVSNGGTFLCDGSDLGGRDGCAAASSMAMILKAAGQAITAVGPTRLFAIGDRIDMIPAVLAGLAFNIPIVHLHGGEVTEGAMDDRIRHAITKLAHIHCVSCASAKAFVSALGEEEWRIFQTGASGLDTLRIAPVQERSSFLASVGMNEISQKPFLLATVHPETNACNPNEPLNLLTEALAHFPDLPVLFTGPNSDPGGSQLRQSLMAYVASTSNRWFVDSLGPIRYPNALRHAAAMIGNSSSGIIEAPLFDLPALNIGYRQQGRERDYNVQDVGMEPNRAIQALKKILSEYSPRAGGRGLRNRSVYGDGQSGRRIAEVLINDFEGQNLLVKKLDFSQMQMVTDRAF